MKGLLALDARLSERLRLQPDKKVIWKVAAFFAHSGDSWFWMFALGLIWIFSRNSVREWATVLMFGIVIQAVTVLAIKFLVRRQRPPGDWGAIYRNTDPHSFPSGHAARASFLAVMMCGLNSPMWFCWLIIIWVPLVSLARVAMGVHYLSDVFAGFVVGLVLGWGVLEISPFVLDLIIRLFPFFY